MDIIIRLEEYIKNYILSCNKSLEVLNKRAKSIYQDGELENLQFPRFEIPDSYDRNIAKFAWADRAKKIAMYELQSELNKIKKEILHKSKSYRFFFHYYKQYKCLSIHHRGKCYKVDNVIINVPTESKWNKRQPHLVVQGFCTQFKIKDNIAYVS